MKIVFYPQVIFMLHIFCIEYCLGSSNSFTCTNTMRQSLSRVYFFLRKYNLLRLTSWNGGLCSSFRDRYKVENMKYFLDQTYFYLVSIVISPMGQFQCLIFSELVQSKFWMYQLLNLEILFQFFFSQVDIYHWVEPTNEWNTPDNSTLQEWTQHQRWNIPKSRDYKGHIFFEDQGFSLKESYKALEIFFSTTIYIIRGGVIIR